MTDPKILLVDDHEIVRNGLKSLLRMRPLWQIVGEAGDGNEAIRKTEELKPDVVVMDITLPNLSGIDAARRILANHPDIGVIFFTMHTSEQMVEEALRTGAHGFVLKSDAGKDLAAAIESIPSGKVFISPGLAPLISTHLTSKYPKPKDLDHGTRGVAKTPEQTLSSREREVLQLLAEGKNSKEVAVALGITVKTVETHRSNLMAKLDIHSLAGLVRYAIRNHMVEP